MRRIKGLCLFYWTKYMYIICENLAGFLDKKVRYYSDRNFKIDEEYKLGIYKYYCLFKRQDEI